MPQLKVQNFYSTALTSDIVGIGDTSFTVTLAPTYTSGFLVISPSNASLREIVYFHNVVGNTVSVRAENRGQGGTTAKAHTSQEPVAMKDIAEIFNMFSDSISQCFFVEKTGGFTIKVWGGTVFYNGNPVTVADTSLTLADNQTNYIKYSYPTNTISVDTVNAGNIKAKVIVASGVITSIQYYVAKESYIDFTVTITGALPPQVGESGKALVTDGTNVSWGMPNGTRSGMQTNTTNDSILVIGKSKLPIINADFALGSGSISANGWIGQKSFGWYAGGSGSWVVSYDTGRLKLQTTGSSSFIEARNTDGGYNGITAESIPVEPNTQYTISYYMQTTYVSGDSLGGAKLAVLFQTSAGVSDGENGGAFVKTTTSSTTYTFTFTTGANTRYCNVSPVIYGHTGAATLQMSAWFDNISITCTSRELLKAMLVSSTISGLDEVITEKQDGSYQKTPVGALTSFLGLGYTASSYEAGITAGDILGQIGAQVFKIFGDENVNSGAADTGISTHWSQQYLDDYRTLFIYSKGAIVYGVVGTLSSADVMTYGSPVAIQSIASAPNGVGSALIGTDKVAVIYSDTSLTNAHGTRVLTITGNSISLGAELKWTYNYLGNQTSTGVMGVCRVRDDCYACSVNGVGGMAGWVFTVSGTTITQGPTWFNFGGYNSYPSTLVYLQDNYFGAFFAAQNSNQSYAAIYSITAGSNTVQTTYTSAGFGTSTQLSSVFRFSATEIGVTFSNTYTATYVFTIPGSGTTLTYRALADNTVYIQGFEISDYVFGVINGSTMIVYQDSTELGRITFTGTMPAAQQVYYMKVKRSRLIYAIGATGVGTIRKLGRIFYKGFALDGSGGVMLKGNLTRSGVLPGIKHYLQSDSTISVAKTNFPVGNGILTNVLSVNS